MHVQWQNFVNTLVRNRLFSPLFHNNTSCIIEISTKKEFLTKKSHIKFGLFTKYSRYLQKISKRLQKTILDEDINGV